MTIIPIKRNSLMHRIGVFLSLCLAMLCLIGPLKAESPGPGEIALVGSVVSLEPATQTLTLQVKSYRNAGGLVNIFTAPREKPVSLAGIPADVVASLHPGQTIQVLGPDGGVGTLLVARRIEILPDEPAPPPALTPNGSLAPEMPAHGKPAIPINPGQLQLRGCVVSFDASHHLLRMAVTDVTMPGEIEPRSIDPRAKRVVIPAAASIQLEGELSQQAGIDALKPRHSITIVGTDMGMGLPLFATKVVIGPEQDDPPSVSSQEIGPPPDIPNLTVETLQPWLQEVAEAFPNMAAVNEVTQTNDGRPVLAVVITSQDQPLSAKHRRLVVQCRQHGDEPETTKAGALLIYHLLTTLDRRVLTGLQSCAVVVIPVANPDGAALLTRTNALGQDMNRNWNKPFATEVIGIRDYLADVHPNLVVDVHEWVPGDRCQMPMAEPCGGALAERVAEAMHHACTDTGYAVPVHHGQQTDISLCHRYLGRSAHVPAILFEAIHVTAGNPSRNEAAAQALYTGILSAVTTLGANSESASVASR